MSTSAVLRMVNIWAYLFHPVLVGEFRRKLGYFPNIALPCTYNEKLLWRKIFDRNPLFLELSDKLKAREAFQRLCPNIGLAELLWVGDRPEDIPDYFLTGNVVVKTNHGSGFNYFIRDGQFEYDELTAEVKRWLNNAPYGRKKGEWGYSQIEPKVFVERVLSCETFGEPLWISLHAISGVTILAWIGMGENRKPRRAALFDPEGRMHSSPSRGYSERDRRLPDSFSLPPGFHEAVKYATKLGADIDYVRLDFLCSNNKIYGSEFTFYPLAGLQTYDAEFSTSLTKAWDISRSWFFIGEQLGWRKIYAEKLRAVLGARLLGTRS